ncbi:MAG: tRNA pseudouridine(55) synthase TruB [Fluviicola sp.]|nr:MAG: tRNA pseudouridine(55) synthase TruB [Fluviicola sp.]
MSEAKYDFKTGEVILVDKPLHWTSFDVVNKLRWKLKKQYNVKKMKVGHAGTLDPLATGLLIICTGKKTKISQELTADDKTYTGTFLIGKTTPSFDLETEYNKTYPTDHINDELMNKVVEEFLGEQLQTPPVFSAKKIDGKRAYESARQGKHVEMRQNLIHIHNFTIDSKDFPKVHFEIKCSKGTYIRSIAHDFGKKMGSGACLIALRRTQSGEFSINEAKSVDEWLEIIEETTVPND